MVTVYYSENTQIKFSKEKKAHVVECRKTQVQASGCRLPVESQGQSLILSVTVCDNMWAVLPAREAHTSLGAQGFYLGGGHVGMQSHVTPQRSGDAAWPQATGVQK